MVSEKVAKDYLKRAANAADAAEEAAVRLQQKTSEKNLDALADDTKDVVHNVREAINDLHGEIDKPGELASEHTAKILEAAASVEKDLQEIAEELAEATQDGTANQDPVTTRKSTVQAVKELELLAQKRAGNSIQGKSVFIFFWALWIVCIIAIIYKFNMIGRELSIGGILGFLWGVGATGAYYINRRWKAERTQRLAMIPGAKGIQALVHHLPSWISFSNTEKMEWLNKILAKSWPYCDAAICAEVKSQIEPLMDQYRPPFIKRIYFKKLTFGDAPFRVEGIRVDEKQKDVVQIEVDFRWAGDANIFLAIELLAGGSATRMVPKVSDMAVSGTMRVILSPLLPEIPGFGAAVVSLMKPPIVKFHLDFGAAFGGSYTANAVVAWLDPFLRSTVAAMLVWPRRLVVPLLPEEVTGPLDDLFLRHKAALQVDVISASSLPKMDTIGSADPYVEMYTTTALIEKTSIKKNTLSPVWNERLWLLVQEPMTQFAYITVNDVDMVNVKELMRVNLLKGASKVVNSKDLIGRAMLKISDFVDHAGESIDKVLPLGLDEFSNEDGCGGGRGELKLRVTYWPLEAMGGHADAPFGALIITVIRASNLPSGDLPLINSDPYVKFKIGKESRVTPTIRNSLNPRWLDCKIDFFRVPKDEKLKVQVFDQDFFTKDELLGDVVIDVHREVAMAPGGDVTKSWELGNIAKEWIFSQGNPKTPTLTMRLQWIPFT